ncbi:MAG: hemerythrin family protein [Humidesulfovibrio sp.]|nr:hemerythrin family protein [Humidesulfovibrio sp.]
MASHNAPLIEWDEVLSLGDETIDRQHKRLVALINELHSHLDSPDRDAQVMRCLTSMYLYAKEHFWDEEAFMDRVGYPDRAEHAALHCEFVQKTHDLTDHCLTDASPCEELLDFLVTWFRNHVAVEDAKLVAFAKGRGSAG